MDMGGVKAERGYPGPTRGPVSENELITQLVSDCVIWFVLCYYHESQKLSSGRLCQLFIASPLLTLLQGQTNDDIYW